MVIEKSINGINFSKLYSSVFFATGIYNDASSIGKTYYRLKVSDKNGNTSYSNIVVVDDKASNDIKVYPTVFNQSFNIQNNSNSHLQLQLFDVAGKLVLQQTLQQGTNIINAEDLISQNYFYQIKNGSVIISPCIKSLNLISFLTTRRQNYYRHIAPLPKFFGYI